MKLTKLIAPLALFSLLLSGCEQEVSPTYDGLSIVTMFAGEDGSAGAYQSLIGSFSAENALTISDNSQVATQEWKTAVTQGISTGETVPDVLFFFTGADVSSLILDNQFVSIEEIQAEFPSYASNIRPSTMEFMREIDNRHYAVPVKGFWEGLYCNTDLFTAHQLPLPTNWEALEEAIAVFSQAGITPIAASMTEVPHYWIEHMILSAGGSSNHRLNPYQYVPENWVNALAEMVSLYEMGGFSPNTLTYGNAQAVEEFTSKKAAMLIEGSWTQGSIQDMETTVVLPIPSCVEGRENSTIISGFSSGFYITRQAWEDPNKKADAVALVSYLTSDSAISALCANGGAPAADVSIPGHSTQLDQSIVQLQEKAQEALMPVDSRLNPEAWNYLVATIPDMLQGNVPPSQVMTQVSQLNQW